MVNKLILGTVQMGLAYGVNNSRGKISREECYRILTGAHKAGVKYLDTAEAYGDAHEIIGEFHRAYPDLSFEVITKMPVVRDFAGTKQRLERYLDDLNVGPLYALMFHGFDAYRTQKPNIPELQKLKQQEMFLNLGVSVYTNNELREVIEDESIDIIQLPFNLLDNISLRGKWMELAKKKGKVIHTRSVFLQGLFYKELSDPNPVVRKLAKQLTTLKKLAESKNLTITELALNYCLQQENIDQVLIGVDSINQLNENIRASTSHLDKATMQLINEIRTDDPDLLNPSVWK